MTENMKRFVEAAEKDAALAEAMGKVEKPEDLIALAAEKGVTLTAEDIKPEEATGELSDEELEDVAGGGMLLLSPIYDMLRRFSIWSPASNGVRFTGRKTPSAGSAMHFGSQGAVGSAMHYGGKGAADSATYFGGIGGPVRLGDTDGGTTLPVSLDLGFNGQLQDLLNVGIRASTL